MSTSDFRFFRTPEPILNVLTVIYLFRRKVTKPTRFLLINYIKNSSRQKQQINTELSTPSRNRNGTNKTLMSSVRHDIRNNLELFMRFFSEYFTLARVAIVTHRVY